MPRRRPSGRDGEASGTQTEQPQRVLFEDEWTRFILHVEGGEVGQPTVGGENREVRPEQDLVAQEELRRVARFTCR